MRTKKENALIRFKDESDERCVCLRILYLRKEKFHLAYNLLRERLSRAKVEGKHFTRILGQLMKTGNKLRAIKEVIEEIEQSIQVIDGMITIEIKGNLHSRLNRNSDYRRSCRGKVKYSERSVEQAAIEMTAKIGDQMESYKCRHCDGWHVGHSVMWS